MTEMDRYALVAYHADVNFTDERAAIQQVHQVEVYAPSVLVSKHH